MAFLYGSKITQREITDITETSKSSVNRVLQLFDKKEEDEINYDFKAQLQYLYALYKVLENPFITYHQIRISMSNFGFQISESTFRRICNSLQIKNKFQQPKEKLMQLHKINGKTFSENYLKSIYLKFSSCFFFLMNL